MCNKINGFGKKYPYRATSYYVLSLSVDFIGKIYITVILMKRQCIESTVCFRYWTKSKEI